MASKVSVNYLSNNNITVLPNLTYLTSMRMLNISNISINLIEIEIDINIYINIIVSWNYKDKNIGCRYARKGHPIFLL